MLGGEGNEPLLEGARLRVGHQRVSGGQVLGGVPLPGGALHRAEKLAVGVDQLRRQGRLAGGRRAEGGMRRALLFDADEQDSFGPWQQTASTRARTTPGISAMRSSRSPFEGGIGSPALRWTAERIRSAVRLRRP